jgi:hypothetical protein
MYYIEFAFNKFVLQLKFGHELVNVEAINKT